jgi:LytS/YehU family sensor histidine kinase
VEEQTDRLERLEAQATARLTCCGISSTHFLFNTLGRSVRWCCWKQTDPANAMQPAYRRFCAIPLLASQPARLRAGAEIEETLKLYLGIERMQFEDRLRTDFRLIAGLFSAYFRHVASP